MSPEIKHRKWSIFGGGGYHIYIYNMHMHIYIYIIIIHIYIYIYIIYIHTYVHVHPFLGETHLASPISIPEVLAHLQPAASPGGAGLCRSERPSFWRRTLSFYLPLFLFFLPRDVRTEPLFAHSWMGFPYSTTRSWSLFAVEQISQPSLHSVREMRFMGPEKRNDPMKSRIPTGGLL